MTLIVFYGLNSIEDITKTEEFTFDLKHPEVSDEIFNGLNVTIKVSHNSDPIKRNGLDDTRGELLVKIKTGKSSKGREVTDFLSAEKYKGVLNYNPVYLRVHFLDRNDFLVNIIEIPFDSPRTYDNDYCYFKYHTDWLSEYDVERIDKIFIENIHTKVYYNSNKYSGRLHFPLTEKDTLDWEIIGYNTVKNISMTSKW